MLTSSRLPGNRIDASIVPSDSCSRRVGAVRPDQVIYTVKNADGEVEQRTIPTNFVLWSTGIAMNPFTQRVTDLLPNQSHKKAIETDSHLRVKGSPQGTIYAIGDCATVGVCLVHQRFIWVNG